MSPVFCLYYDCFSPQGDCVQVYEGYPLDKYRSRPLLSLEMGLSNEMNATRICTVLAVFFSPSNEKWTQFRNRPMTKEGIIPVGILRTIGGHFIEDRKGLVLNIIILSYSKILKKPPAPIQKVLILFY
jgi:hypothetical protein